MGTTKPKLLNDLVDLENIRIEQVFENLRCDKEGLSDTDVAERLCIYGHNKLEEKTESKFLKFLRYSWNPLSRTMVFAAIMAIVLANGGGKPPDWLVFLGIITFLILTSSAYSCVVEIASDIAARVQLPKFSRVLRVGQGGWYEEYSSNLVPGDIISIKKGDIVPADARILEYCTADPVVKIDQSDLTGESLPITKSRPGDCVYSGSTCQQGEIIKAVVIATGVHTRYRNAAAAHVVDSSNQVKCFQRVSKGIGNFCIRFVAVVMTVEIIVMYCMQHRAYRSGIDNLLVLLIGGIPIGMPLVLLLIMERGVYNLYYVGIKRMTTIIDLACMDVLCSDMTRTLTRGMLKVQRDLIEVFANDINKDTVALMAARACKSEECARLPGISLLLPHCPTDKETSHTYSDGEGKKHRVSIGKPEHILNHYAHNKSDLEHKVHSVIDMFAEKGLQSIAVAYQEFPSNIEHRVHSAIDMFAEKVLHSIAVQDKLEVPSDIEQSVHSAIDMFAEKVLHSITVAFQEVPSDIKHTVRSMIDMFAEKVLHSIAEAYQEVPHGAKEKSGGPWQFIGLLPFVDPPRDDCASSITELLNYGVNVKMITRDQLIIGKEIGRRVGMGTNMYPSSALLEHNNGQDKSIADDDDLSIDELIEKADGFVSCVLPEHKYEIIKHLQSRKHVCGMIGGAADDVPALKKADIRIAPYGASEAACNAADIVLMEPGLKYFCQAILTSRSITMTMKSYMVYVVSIAIHNVLGFMLLALVWKFDFPPFKMLLIAVVNCSISMGASMNRVKSSPLPVNWSLSEILTTGIVLGSYLAMSTVLFFWTAYETNFFRLEKTAMQLVSAVFLQVSTSNYVLMFVTRIGSVSPGCNIHVFICVFYLLSVTMFVAFGIGWGCAGKIWLYNMVFYALLYCIKCFNQRTRKGFLKSTL